jgi:hypothetical protein
MKVLFIIGFATFIVFMVAGTFFRVGKIVGRLMERCRPGAKVSTR